ncbi:MAG TPA: HPr family phosphocarrier protein [Phycisphaerales bacterium]|nr:HPr family phosphocarrier protein [Phycisphaerales bacterium]HMP38207.1 HPr family phosphocarrier protein [Phycisphaerales bacterium]
MSERVIAIVKIVNRLGLHARPAMAFVQRATDFDCSVRVRRVDADEMLDGKSIMQLMMLAATQGTEIEIVAEGPQASAAIEALSGLVASRFDEE